MTKQYIGIDVSKQKLDVCWLRDPQNNKLKTKKFDNSRAGVAELWGWVRDNTNVQPGDCVFILEATGVYHERAVNALYSLGVVIRMAQPQQFHHYVASHGVRSKTDKRDSILLARYGADGKGRAWQPEPSNIRHLKKLLGRLEALEQDIRREKNRLEAAEVGDFPEDIVASISRVIQALSEEKALLEKQINDHIDGDPTLKNNVTLLQSIPGIGAVVSRHLLCAVLAKPFAKARDFAAYIGLTPIVRESGTSVRSRPKLSKAGCSLLRAKLYMAAVVAIRYNQDAKALYTRLTKRGKAKMSALGAVMRKLAHICFGVLKHGKEYYPQTLQREVVGNI